MTDPRLLHTDAVVVDTHNDLILLVDHFDRRHQRDHFAQFWLPELRAGGVDVQVLPICIDLEFQSEGALRRTLLLVERIHELAAEHSDDVAVCLTGADVDAATASGRIALIIALEGAHAIGQDPALVRTMARVGVRVVSIAHLGRTFLADGSGLDATSRGGLTPEGVTALREMDEVGIVFDISHLGIAGVEDVLSLATRPFLATHSACLGITDSHRNLGDEQIKAIAGLGGVIGVAAAIPFFIDPTSPSADRVVDHIEHVIDVAGIDHVGLGPDFIDDYYQNVLGGWVGGWAPPTYGHSYRPAEIARPSDLPKITEVMVRRGFAESDIRKVLGENVLRVLREVMGKPTR
ncbi:dipeptidase [Actinocrispum wychmicini]|uniref:Membrane dipeptidase n=1 Tax=Actinocrispum wychmicini TaxID=1213861 RepID=A0A4R2JI91_9PSEU|nr:membrane dipeptidase [Actinocrispum wychmicini]TCO59621.1 membrane dipeptidase [Actinocrispum wychmicini]